MNTVLFVNATIGFSENLFLIKNSCNTGLVSILFPSTFISTTQTDLGPRSRTLSLKINKLPTFSEINQEWQCLKIVFIQ